MITEVDVELAEQRVEDAVENIVQLIAEDAEIEEVMVEIQDVIDELETVNEVTDSEVIDDLLVQAEGIQVALEAAQTTEEEAGIVEEGLVKEVEIVEAATDLTASQTNFDEGVATLAEDIPADVINAENTPVAQAAVPEQANPEPVDIAEKAPVDTKIVE